MAARFVVSRVGLQRFMIRYKDHYVAECLGDDPKQIKLTLSLLGLDGRDARLQGELRAALELFLFREKRAEEKFGKAKLFRIWRIDAKTLQVDFKGGHTELKNRATSLQALKRCLHELGANDFVLPDLKRELAAFRKDERPEPCRTSCSSGTRESSRSWWMLGSTSCHANTMPPSSSLPGS
jgi:hypothetical protein